MGINRGEACVKRVQAVVLHAHRAQIRVHSWLQAGRQACRAVSGRLGWHRSEGAVGLGLEATLAIMVKAAVATATGERRGFEWRRRRAQEWEVSCPVRPRACPGHICTDINSLSGCGTGITAACTQAVNLVSKLLQNKSLHIIP